MIEQLICVHNT